MGLLARMQTLPFLNNNSPHSSTGQDNSHSLRLSNSTCNMKSIITQIYSLRLCELSEELPQIIISSTLSAGNIGISLDILRKVSVIFER